MIDKVKDYFGARSTSVMINGHSYPFLNKPEREVRFCEAVHYSFNLPIEINDQTLSCPGARRTFGYDNQEITISFGCPESRNFGGVEKDEAIVGIPYKMAKTLLK